MNDGLVEGRHVFYQDTDGTHAAIVAKVDGAVDPDGNDQTTVTLMVIDFNGGTYAKQDVHPDPRASSAGIVESGQPTVGTWRWMYHRQGTTYTPGQKPGSLDPAGAKG